MPKPKWLKDNESRKNRPDPTTCDTCQNFKGRFSKYIRYKGTENCDEWECKIHKGCLNTKHSVKCSDYIRSIV